MVLLAARATLGPRRFELIALFPSHQLWRSRGLPAKREPEPRHGRIGGEIHARVIFIARLVIMIGGVVVGLLLSPGRVVALVFDARVYREPGNAHARKTEMIRTIVV